MYEIVREFCSNGVPVKVGTLDGKSIPKDHLECALRNGWAVQAAVTEQPKKSPRGDKTKE